MIPRLEEISFHEDAAPTDVAKAFEQYGAVILKSSFPTDQVELIGRRAASIFDYIEAEVVAGRDPDLPPKAGFGLQTLRLAARSHPPEYGGQQLRH